MQYEWDPAKAEANLAAHDVSFTEAVTVLEDDFALTREDPDSEGEQRFVTLGMRSFAHVLVVKPRHDLLYASASLSRLGIARVNPALGSARFFPYDRLMYYRM